MKNGFKPQRVMFVSVWLKIAEDLMKSYTQAGCQCCVLHQGGVIDSLNVVGSCVCCVSQIAVTVIDYPAGLLPVG